jgi:hypothetical protein
MGENMMTTDTSKAEFLTAQVFASAVPVVTILAGLIFISFTLLLAFKTKAPGRFTILAGTLVFVLFGVHQVLRFRDLAIDGVLGVALGYFIPLSGMLIVAAGYAQLVWALMKNEKAAEGRRD